MKNNLMLLCSIFALTLAAGQAHSKVSKSEAQKLGKSLTPFGSIQAGNKAKTIPEWTGGITKAPEGYKGTGQHHIDPFADDEIKFTIDKSKEKYRCVLFLRNLYACL